MEGLLFNASSFRLFQMTRVLKEELILSSVVLVTLTEWLVLRNKLNYAHTKIGSQLQPHQPSVLVVYPTQMLKYLRFN